MLTPENPLPLHKQLTQELWYRGELPEEDMSTPESEASVALARALIARGFRRLPRELAIENLGGTYAFPTYLKRTKRGNVRFYDE